MSHEGPIILLTIDSLREDFVSNDTLKKSLDILEKDFAYFSNAYSYGVSTPFAFPGIIAGTHAVGDGRIPEECTTYAELISGKSIAYSNNGNLRPERGYARGFDYIDTGPNMGNMSQQSTNSLMSKIKNIGVLRDSKIIRRIYKKFVQSEFPQPTDSSDKVIELIKDELNPGFNGTIWGHFMDPHTPYHPGTAIGLPDNTPNMGYLSDLNDRIMSGSTDQLSKSDLRLTKKLYESNIRYFDKYFSNLLFWMQEQPWYDRSFIIVVSDHGEHLGENGKMFHPWDSKPSDELIHTPLWVKYPEKQDSGKNFDHIVGHGDIFASVVKVHTNQDVRSPINTIPLRNNDPRHIVSLSNTHKRLTEADGIYIERLDGTTKQVGSISSDGKKILKKVEFPKCTTSSGDVVGVKEARRRKQLRQLGYR